MPSAMLLAVVLAAIGATTTSLDSARAATTGAGIPGITPYGGFLGNYLTGDGGRAYCVDSSRDWPSGATGPGLNTTSLTTDDGDVISGPTLQKINYVLGEYGQTADSIQAAAVSAYVYAYTSRYGHSNPTMSKHTVGSHFISGNTAVQARYNSIWDDAEAHYNDERNAPAAPVVTIRLTADSANSYHGTIIVSGLPAGIPADITLTNAVFDTSHSPSGRMGNGTLGVTGTPSAGAGSYTVSAKAKVTLDGGYRYPASVKVYETGSQQRIIRDSGTTPVPHVYEYSATDSPRSALFKPVITSSKTTEYLPAGTPSDDKLTVSVADGTSPWRTTASGANETVTASGVLYGPFAAKPAQNAAVPKDAPVATSLTAQLTGPGEYTATAPASAVAASGFYTWVWTIDAAQQSTGVRALLPVGYHVTTDFGIGSETGVHPWGIVASSQVSDEAVGLGQASHDVLTLALDGDTGWPEVDGTPVELNVKETVYFLPHAFSESGDDTPSEGGTEAGSEAESVIPTGTGAGNSSTTGTGTDTETGAAEATPNTGTGTTPGGTEGSQVGGSEAHGSKPDQTATATTGESVPANARVLTQWSTDVTSAGNIEAPTITAPESESGYIVHVWEASTKEGSTAYFVPWVDAFGSPNEVTRVLPPTVTTAATGVVARLDSGSDTATVGGMLPAEATVEWSIYRIAGPSGTSSSETGAAPSLNADVADSPDADNATGPGGEGATAAASPPPAITSAAVCNDSTRYWPSDGHPAQVPVDKLGDYPSPKVTFDTLGRYAWQATLRAPDGTIIAQDACAESSEITTVAEDGLATQATPTVFLGQEAQDVATLTGTLPESATITWEVFERRGNQPVCQEGNRVFADTSHSVTGPGEYSSESFAPPRVGRYDWVATIRNAGGVVTERGVCGDPKELTEVVADIHANTGGSVGSSGQSPRAGNDTIYLAGLAALAALTVAGALRLGSSAGRSRAA